MMERIPNFLLQRARQEKNLTQLQLAKLVGVSEQSIQSWESGKRHVRSPEYRARLCEILEKTPQDLGLLPVEDSPEPVQELERPSEKPFLLRRSGDVNRSRMIGRVRDTWVEGVLKESLHQAARIALGLQEQPDALANPFQLSVQETNLSPRPLPPGTSIGEVYDEANGELLILGEPGAGKTTLLLELARKLLVNAEQDEECAVPVVLNLASWMARQLPFAEWLMEELRNKYHVPKRVAQQWVQRNHLALLLDGLDEVAETGRTACVKAILSYKEKCAPISLVLCSRTAEYFALSTRVTLRRAVVIQPLTFEQIEEYLSQAGGQLEVVQKALRDDPDLREMVQSPLMLNIVALTYQGNQAAPVLTGEKEEQRRHILSMYVRRMLSRRGVAPYHSLETLRWLIFLATQMERHNQNEFYLERLQPDWLPGTNSLRQYRLAVIRCVFGLAVVLYAGLFACFRGDSFPNQPGLFYWLGGGKGNTVLGWMAPGLGSGLQGAGSLGILFALVAILVMLLTDRREMPTLTRKDIGRGLLSGLRSGVPIGGLLGIFAALVFSRVGGLSYGLFRGTGIALFSGFIVLLMSGLISLLREPSSLTRKGQLSQNNNYPHRLRDRLLNAVIFGLCATLSFASLFSLQSGGFNTLALSFGITDGFFHAIVFGIGNGTDLMHGLGIEIRPAETVAWSWQAARQSFSANLKKGTLLGLSILVSVIVAIACMSGLFYGIAYGLRYSFIYGLIVGLIATVASVLTGVLTSGWSSDILDEHLLGKPNEGTHRSFNHALFAGGIFGSIGGLASGLISAFAFGLGGIAGWSVLGTGLMIIFGLIFAFHFLIHYGGIAWVEHYILRWYLWRKGVIPWNYVCFLDYAAERILLRKVGGGYIFVHRLLLDHFASQDGKSLPQHLGAMPEENNR